MFDNSKLQIKERNPKGIRFTGDSELKLILNRTGCTDQLKRVK